MAQSSERLRVGVKHDDIRGRNFETTQVIRAFVILGLILCVMAPHAWAQQPPPSGLRQQAPEPEEEETERRGSPLLRIPILGPTLAPTFPALSGYPLELLGLLMSPLERREVNLLPAIAISEEFTDNIFLNNDNKRIHHRLHPLHHAAGQSPSLPAGRRLFEHVRDLRTGEQPQRRLRPPESRRWHVLAADAPADPHPRRYIPAR